MIETLIVLFVDSCGETNVVSYITITTAKMYYKQPKSLVKAIIHQAYIHFNISISTRMMEFKDSTLQFKLFVLLGSCYYNEKDGNNRR